MFRNERLTPQFRRAIVASIALVLLSSMLIAARDDRSTAAATDPRSVEWVCTHLPDRVRVLFDSLSLDRPGLERAKQAVGEGDYPSACRALIDYYRGARSASWLRRRPVADSGKNDPKADPILSDQFEFYAEKATVPRTGSGNVAWSYNGPKSDPEWGFSLNNMDYLNTLLSAYLRTGRLAYVERIDQDVRDWILSNPPPNRMMKPGPWRTITAASRINSWMNVFYGLQAVDEFSPAARILMLSSVADHARYLMLFHHRDENWTLAEMGALGAIGCAWPEFSDAAGWRAYSQETMGSMMRSIVYPDGAEAELTCHYHRKATETFDDFAGTFRQFGYPVADSIEVGIRRMWSYLACTLRPDGTTPQTNDADRIDIRAKLIAAAKVHDRPDWTYIATGGKEGNVPRTGPSMTFPWAGHAVMRNGWAADAQWSFFDAGPFGVAHGHNDKLHVSIDAYGRALLVDAGRFHYSKGPFPDYFVGSPSHNVLLIDGAGQNRTAARAERPLGGTDYGSTPEFDYARGVFDAGYQNVKGRAVHTRTVVYVRDRFWIVADRVETDRERRVDALWHFAPECNVIVEGNSVLSNDPDTGNLRIAPIGGISWQATVVEGSEKPVQGWYSRAYTEKEPNPAVVFAAHIPGTTTFAWVIVPARGVVPPVEARVLSSTDDRVEVRVKVGTDPAFVATVPMNSWRPTVRREG